jgi:hypothetical protein
MLKLQVIMKLKPLKQWLLVLSIAAFTGSILISATKDLEFRDTQGKILLDRSGAAPPIELHAFSLPEATSSNGENSGFIF